MDSSRKNWYSTLCLLVVKLPSQFEHRKAKLMPANPDTRESLILRLPSARDADAWQEFIDLYEPLVIRFARRRGLQDADAREIAQNVFISVAKAVDRWQPDRERGKFRAWLFRIARNQLINWVAKHSRDRGSGRTSDFIAMAQINAMPQPQDELELDYRREMFRLAAAHVRASFSKSSWDAFWRTSVLNESIESVALSLGISHGAIYIARSRITARIKLIVEQWEHNDAF